MELVVCKTGYGKDLPLPEYQSDGAAGFDLHAAIGQGNSITLAPGGIVLVPCGIIVEIPVGCEGQVRGRSGLALRYGVSIVQGVGTVDSDYRGEVGALLINHGAAPFVVRHGDRVAQMVIARVERLAFRESRIVGETARGAGGFGSTGR